MNARNLILAGTILFAAVGIGIGVSQACDGNPTRDEQIRDLKKTANAADRKADKARTQIAILTQTPQK